MTGIYHIYTMHIPCTYQTGGDITVIYQEYLLYILHCIYCGMGPWRAGSHSTGSTSNHIAWMGDNFYFAPLLHTLVTPALGHVDVQGTPGTVNSQDVQCLTGKTYKPIFLDLYHSCLRRGPNDKDNQTNC